jgi:malonate transporter MadM subunit
MMDSIYQMFLKNGLVLSFLAVGFIMLVTQFVSQKILRDKIPGVALAIALGLILASFGGKTGIADIPLFSGMALLGGTMLRDFAIVSTAYGASMDEIKKAGWVGVVSLFVGVFFNFIVGVTCAIFFGYSDPAEIATLASGTCTFIVGPITGNAVGASSEIITLSIAAGVMKVLIVSVVTPLFKQLIGIETKTSAMVFGGVMGTVSGVSAALASINPKLVPYGALTATFYTGIAAILCPSVFYPILKWILI